MNVCHTRVYLANFSSSCFMPALTNSTVALQLSPVPSTLTTVPNPNLVCSMRSPGFSGALMSDVGEGAGGGVGRLAAM